MTPVNTKFCGRVDHKRTQETVSRTVMIPFQMNQELARHLSELLEIFRRGQKRKKKKKQKRMSLVIAQSLSPAIMSSTVLIFSSTCWMRPTSVLVCRLRTLLRRMAVNMLQISAWHVTSQCDSSSTMQPMLSASWMMKFISRSNSPPTS